MAAGGRDPDGTRGLVKVWDAATGRELRTLRTDSAVLSLAFGPDGSVLAGGREDRVVTVLELNASRERLQLGGHANHVHALAFSPDGTRLASAGCLDGAIRLWDTADGRLALSLRGHSQGIFALAFGPDGATLASAGGDRAIKLWEAAP